MESAAVTLGDTWGTEAALSEAFLASLEKYQGAQAAGDGSAALLHARSIRQYALLLVSNLIDANAAIDAMLAQLGASGNDLEGLYDGLKAEQDRVMNSGLDSGELRIP